jgi:hypothetical protein
MTAGLARLSAATPAEIKREITVAYLRAVAKERADDRRLGFAAAHVHSGSCAAVRL